MLLRVEVATGALQSVECFPRITRCSKILELSGTGKTKPAALSDPRNRNHKSLAIANHNFEVAAFPAEIAMKSQFYRCLRSRSDFFELRLQSLAIAIRSRCDSGH